MKRLAFLACLLIAVGCDDAHRSQAPKLAPAQSPPVRAITTDQLQLLLASNATVIGHLYSAEKPWVVASFSNGRLQWRNEAGPGANAEGKAELFVGADRSCIGFEQKNVTLSTHGPEQFLVCEALKPISDSNSLPRAQDFWFQPRTLFLQYQPPPGTGFTQYYYATPSKQ
jgi:hypothetical protein